ncbi:Hypothetical protein A7982_03684 [Minicystis rosea]|nr:Hypothetical protein A7982_03684 [Minicystis rosea]
MKIVARVLPLVLALMVPSLAFAGTPNAKKSHAGQTTKRVKAQAKPHKAVKAKAPKAAKKAPKAPKAAKKAAIK